MNICCRLVAILAIVTSAVAQVEPHELAVRVVDHRGKAAVGVPLVVGRVSPVGDSMSFSTLPKSKVKTDAEGRARFQIGTEPSRWSNLHVQADIAADPPVRVPVPRSRDEVVVTLPPTGSVRVIVFDDNGDALSGVRNVTLEVAGSKRFFDRLKVRGEIEEEGSLFRWVGLDLELSVRAAIEGVGSLHVRRPGPTIPTELAVFDISTRESSIARVEFVDALGKPLRNHSLVTVLSAGRSRRSFAVTTNEDGIVKLTVPKPFLDAADARWILCDVDAGGASFTLDLGVPWVGLRDVVGARLAPGEVVMRGRAVDTRGAPVSGLELDVPLSWISGARSRSHHGRRPAKHRVRTDEKGVFEVREHAPRDGGRVQAEAVGGWQLERARVRYGDLDITLIARRPGRVELVMRGVPPGTDVSMLQLLRRNRGPGIFGANFEPLLTEAVGDSEAASVVAFDDLQHTTYDLYVGGMGRVKGLRPGIKVVEPTEDAAAVRVTYDWKQDLKLIRPRLIQPDGTAIAGSVMVYQVNGGGHSGRSAGVTPEGRPFLVPKRSRIVFEHPSWRSFELRELKEKMDIHVQPRFPARFVLPRGIELPRGVRVQTAVEELAWKGAGPVDIATHPGQPLTAMLDGAGNVVVTVSVPTPHGGDYDVAWQKTVVVPEPVGNTVVEVPLPIDQEAIDDIRARLEK